MKTRNFLRTFIIFAMIIILVGGCELMKKDNDNNNNNNNNNSGVPTLSTTSIYGITTSSATSGGTITAEGGSAITAKGICWSLYPNPTINSNKTTDGYGSGSFTSSMTALSTNTVYYVCAYATNSSGTGYGNQLDFTTGTVSLAVGDFYQGGKIAYIFRSGDQGYYAGETHGLIAAPYAVTGLWGCYGTTIGGTSTLFGTGNNNTLFIMNGCSDSDVAAKKCYDLERYGYSDWYMASIGEIERIMVNRIAVGYTHGNYLLSSSEYMSSTDCWAYDLQGNQTTHITKSHMTDVAVIRRF